LWLEDFPDLKVAPVKENDFTPRLGAVFHAGTAWSLYGQYARGFRAPPFEDANIGLDLPLFGYRAIPNPDLKSETSDGVELGTRRIASGSRFSFAVFDTHYDDFIESRAPVGIDAETGYLLFQSRNIGQARIYGADVRLDQDLDSWSASLQGWTLNLAACWSGKTRQ
jgi:hemoglobin/transferrin/lactoferrin receptor protein